MFVIEATHVSKIQNGPTIIFPTPATTREEMEAAVLQVSTKPGINQIEVLHRDKVHIKLLRTEDGAWKFAYC